MKLRARLLFGLLVLALGSTLLGKGPTVKLTVTGPGVDHPVEITDSRALANVYSNDWFAAPAAGPSTKLPRYVVSFHVDLERGQGVRVMYAVRYVHDPATGEGFVYLPGRGDEMYKLNVTTIMREGVDGRWYRASKNWDVAIWSRLRTETVD